MLRNVTNSAVNRRRNVLLPQFNNNTIQGPHAHRKLARRSILESFGLLCNPTPYQRELHFFSVSVCLSKVSSRLELALLPCLGRVGAT